MTNEIKWGILAPGSIAKQFATGMKDAGGNIVYAAASRTQQKAENFIKEFGGEKAYGSYADLIADDAVDAIYIASPHTLHAQMAVDCLKAGKPVLCEKPLAVNEAQVQSMIDAADESGTFLMEGMWTRFFPAVKKAKELVDSGTVGEVRMVECSFGFRAGMNPESRLLNPGLAGGGLLDVGVYTVAMAHHFLGTPDSVTGSACIGKTGVDEQNACVLTHEGGALSVLTSAVRTNTRHECRIYGTDATLRIVPPFWHPEQLSLEKPGADPDIIDIPFKGNGFNYEIEAAGQCITEGKTVCDTITTDESLAIMKTMDALRAQWGLKYPFEQETGK